MLKFFPAPEIKVRVRNVVEKLRMDHVDPNRVIVFKSKGTKSDAIARCWELPRIWQQALCIEPHYVIEFCSEKYNKLDKEDKDKVIIHELLHIPKTFSGALRPHKGYVDGRTINRLHRQFKKSLEFF